MSWVREPIHGKWIDRSRFTSIGIAQNLPGLASACGEWSVRGRLVHPRGSGPYDDMETLAVFHDRREAQEWLDSLMAGAA